MLAFNSDSDSSGAAFASGSFPTVIIEPNGPYDGTRYLDPALQARGYHLYFQSSVPEPGSIALLIGTGLSAGMLALRRNRRK